MKKLTNKLVAVAAVSGGFATSAFAAGTDPDISVITAAGASVAAIGAAVFAVYVGIKVFKWARAAL
jgi:Na+-translocating ferredoxin:NAD+ oxidoreductase RnfD subunit